MRKKYIFSGVLFLLIITSYLFYKSCKRDTIVINQVDRVSIPDSAWLYGSINLEKIRREIAWSTITNGDFSKLFQTDTNSSVLYRIIKSPDIYSIAEQNNILYFSCYKQHASYNGLIFKLANHAALKKTFKSDSISIKQKKCFTFRTQEGIWFYNSYNLLLIFTDVQDSAAACHFFNENVYVKESGVADDNLLSCQINTTYIPDHLQHPLLDSTEIYVTIKSNTEKVDIDWKYQGPATNAFNQSVLPLPAANTGLYYTGNHNGNYVEQIIQKTADQNIRTTKEQAFLHQLFTALNKNTLSLKFDGWKKIKNSYYVNTMNEEFEMILQKKDTDFIEPIFKIALTQKENNTTEAFLSYLQSEGLVSKKPPFKIIYGNFDSELKIAADSSIVVQNKHINTKSVEEIRSTQAAFFLQINMSEISGLWDRSIKKPTFIEKNKKIESVRNVTLTGYKNSSGLYGTMQIEFKDADYPLLALIKAIRK